MKTLHLVGNWESDVGYAWKMIEQFWVALAQSYPGRTILTFPKVRTVSPVLKASGIEIIEFDFQFGRPEELANFVQKYNVGHLYLSDRPYTSPVYRKLRRAGVETITIHDHTPGARTFPAGLKRLGKALTTRWMGADAYIATTEYVRQRHLNVACAPSSRCHVAPNGVNTNHYTREHSTIRAELGIGPDTTLIVSSSRAAPIKRIETIIEAANLLPQAQFIHLGKGTDVAYWEHLLSLAPPNFRMMGDRNDVLKILPGCDIGIHAAEGEVGYSLATLEFMAAGLPTIVRNDPSVCACINEWETGLLFDSPESLVDRVSYLIEHPEERQRLGANAKRIVLRDYALEDTIDSVVAIMRQVIQGTEPLVVSARTT